MARRWVWKTAVALVLGLATSIGAAWGMAVVLARVGYAPGMVLDGKPAKALQVQSKGLVADVVFWQRTRVYESYYFPGWVDPADFPSSRFGPFAIVPRWCLPEPRQGVQHSALALGWPRPALCFEASGWDLARREGVDFEYRGAVRLGRGGTAHAVRLPLIPIPSGLIIDTAFYGSLWFFLLVAPRTARRRWRIYRGLCPWCGYDRTGLVVCPECGRT